jgi:hypothetical protein
VNLFNNAQKWKNCSHKHSPCSAKQRIFWMNCPTTKNFYFCPPMPTNATLADKFSRMDIFRSVPRPVLEHLADQSRIEEVPAGGVVFQKGDLGRSLFLILDGETRVHDGEYTVAHMHAGHCFGEMALLDEGPRSMSVTATAHTLPCTH